MLKEGQLGWTLSINVRNTNTRDGGNLIDNTLKPTNNKLLYICLAKTTWRNNATVLLILLQIVKKKRAKEFGRCSCSGSIVFIYSSGLCSFETLHQNRYYQMETSWVRSSKVWRRQREYYGFSLKSGKQDNKQPAGTRTPTSTRIFFRNQCQTHWTVNQAVGLLHFNMKILLFSTTTNTALFAFMDFLLAQRARVSCSCWR